MTGVQAVGRLFYWKWETVFLVTAGQLTSSWNYVTPETREYQVCDFIFSCVCSKSNEGL